MLSPFLQSKINNGVPSLGESVRLFRTSHAAQSVAFIEAAGAAAANFAISIMVARTYDAATFSGYITALSAAFVAIAFLRISFTTPGAIKPDHWYNRKLRSPPYTY
jgi:hypothetical protein